MLCTWLYQILAYPPLSKIYDVRVNPSDNFIYRLPITCIVYFNYKSYLPLSRLIYSKCQYVAIDLNLLRTIIPYWNIKLCTWNIKPLGVFPLTMVHFILFVLFNTWYKHDLIVPIYQNNRDLVNCLTKATIISSKQL